MPSIHNTFPDFDVPQPSNPDAGLLKSSWQSETVFYSSPVSVLWLPPGFILDINFRGPRCNHYTLKVALRIAGVWCHEATLLSRRYGKFILVVLRWMRSVVLSWAHNFVVLFTFIHFHAYTYTFKTLLPRPFCPILLSSSTIGWPLFSTYFSSSNLLPEQATSS